MMRFVKGNVPWIKGRKHSKKTIKKMSETKKRLFKEGKLKIVHSEETKRKIGKAHKGKKLSEEMKQKLRTLFLGRKHSNETKRKMSEKRKGEKHPLWKGKFAGVSALHIYVKKIKMKVLFCERCGKEKPLELAFKNHHAKKEEYTRNPDDYIWLCNRCHMTVDGRINNLLKSGYKTRWEKGLKRTKKLLNNNSYIIKSENEKDEKPL